MDITMYLINILNPVCTGPVLLAPKMTNRNLVLVLLVLSIPGTYNKLESIFEAFKSLTEGQK